jgi:uncharacterized protein YceK
MRSLSILIAIVAVLAACGGTATAPPPQPPASTAAGSIPSLPDAAQAWCVQHLGGPAENQHQVEDAALSLGLLEGAKTREDVFAHWGGMSPQDLRVSVRTYVIACQAAYEKSSAPAA